MASRVFASGAWRATRSSHDCLVSSMAAHSSPRGSTPAAANASPATCVSTLPNCLQSERVGQPPGGVDGEHQDLATEVGGGHGRGRGGGRGLADPTRPAVDHDLLGRQQLLERPGRVHAACDDGPSRYPSSSARCVGDLAGGPHPVGALEQVGDVEQREFRPAARRGAGPGVPALVRRSVTASSAPSSTGLTGAPTAASQRRGLGRLAQAVEHCFLAPAEQLGQDPVDDDRGEVDDRLLARAGRPARWSR